MPIVFTNKKLKATNPLAKPIDARTPSDKAYLSQLVLLTSGTSVLLEPDSSKVAAGYALSQFKQPVLILHCDETQRSALLAVHVSMHAICTYDRQLSYITKAATSSTIHAAIVVHADSAPPSLTSNLRTSAERMGLQISITSHVVPSNTEGILFERAGGKSTCFLPSPRVNFNSSWWPEPNVELIFAPLCTDLTLFQMMVDILHGVVVTEVPCVYDGAAYPKRLPVFSNHARDTLAVVKREIAAARKSGRSPDDSDDWRDNMDAPLGKLNVAGAKGLRRYLMPLWLFGPLCGVCAKMGVSKQCAGCGVECYCSVEHQREHWPHHKT